MTSLQTKYEYALADAASLRERFWAQNKQLRQLQEKLAEAEEAKGIYERIANTKRDELESVQEKLAEAEKIVGTVSEAGFSEYMNDTWSRVISRSEWNEIQEAIERFQETGK